MPTTFILLLCLPVICSSVAAGSSAEAGYCDNGTPEKCYLIYKRDNNPVKRDEADYACTQLGQSLASIPDEETQDVMEKFATVADEGAWVSGKRQISEWMDLSSTSVAGVTISGSDDDNKRCVVLHFDTRSHLDTAFHATECTTEKGRRALCQYPRTDSTDCELKFGTSSYCFKVFEDTFKTFDDAKTFCQGVSSRMKLSNSNTYLADLSANVSYIKQYIYFNSVNKQAQNPEENEFWLGIHREYEWSWKKQNSDTPISYTNWAHNQPNTENSCMTIDLSSEAAWMSTPCDETRQYYICTGNKDDIPTTTTTTTSTSTTTTTTTSTTTASTTTSTSTTTTTTPPTTTTSTTPTTTTVSHLETTAQGTNGSMNSLGSTSGTNDMVLVLIIVFSVGGFLFIIGVIVAIYVSRMDGKDDESVTDDDEEFGNSGFDPYSEAFGVKSYSDSIKRGRDVPDRQAVVKKAKRLTDHEQVQDIFINPNLRREDQPDGSEDNTTEPYEDRGNATASDSGKGVAHPQDDFVVSNPVYSVNRSQFTGNAMNTYQNFGSLPLPSPQDSAAPPLPPKSLSLQRLSAGNRVSAATVNDGPDMPPPPPPLIEEDESPRNYSPEYERRSGVGEARAANGRIELNRDNMMF